MSVDVLAGTTAPGETTAAAPDAGPAATATLAAGVEGATRAEAAAAGTAATGVETTAAVTRATTAPGVTVAGWGAALPDGRVTNADLEARLDTSDEWISTRTGIRERRWATDGETTGPLATLAAARALATAGIDAADVDLVIVATCTPEVPMPSTAAMVAAALGTRAGGFDLNAACAGFPYALATASSLLAAGAARTVVVVGADTMSRIVDPTDRNTAVLFGDGAAAVALTTADQLAGAGGEPAPGTAASDDMGRAVPGLLAADLFVDGAGADLLLVPAGGSRLPASADTVEGGLHTIRMQGRELFRQAVRAVATSVERTLAAVGVTAADVGLFVPHQANTRITGAVLARTGLTEERTWSNLDHLGNTSAASIPLALCEAADAGALHDGDLVLVCGFGAGLTVGTVLWRWVAGGGALDV